VTKFNPNPESSPGSKHAASRRLFYTLICTPVIVSVETTQPVQIVLTGGGFVIRQLVSLQGCDPCSAAAIRWNQLTSNPPEVAVLSAGHECL